MSLRLVLSQSSVSAGARLAPRPTSHALAVPKARPEGPTRGGFVVGHRRLESKKPRRLNTPAAGAASSSSFFPSPFDDSKQKPPSLTRERPLAGIVTAAIQVGLALIKIARQLVLGIGLGVQQQQQQQQQQQRTMTAAATLTRPPPPLSSSWPLLPPRPTAPLRSALSMLADTAFSLEQKLEKWGVFMLAARARAVSAATSAAGGGGKPRRRRAKEAAAAKKSSSSSATKDRRVSVAAAAAALYDATTAATGSDDSALTASVLDAEAALNARIFASMLLSPPESEEEKKKKRRR